mgnify:CR=1 FL=1
MITNRFIIKQQDFEPIKNLIDTRAYISASFATSSCNWNDHVYCDVTFPNPEWNVSVHKWMSFTGSVCHFISAI